MWIYILRRLLYNVPVYLGIILLVMAALRVQDPVYLHLGKFAKHEDYVRVQAQLGLDQPFPKQYAQFVWKICTLNFEESSWDNPGISVGTMIRDSIGPSLALTLPALAITSLLSVVAGLISAFYRGRSVDRGLVVLMVLGMSISFLVYIILGQYFGAFKLNQWLGRDVFAIDGYEPGLANWPYYCLLPVIISVVVAMGYDTRFYRAVMVEESGRDYITTAEAKGATRNKIMFVHMLKNAMIPIITRIATSLPFLITGSILLEMYFGIPGMGRALIQAVHHNDFPVIQAFAALFAALYILTNILTDVTYALVDPRVRLS